jgi:5'-nucleotidase (lipoprotein e(P4) family)
MRPAFFFLAAASLCAQPHENLNAVVWMQNAAEYAAAARQAFRAAELALDRALRAPNWTAALEQMEGFEKLPPGVILDLDETVLDNSVHQARLTAAGARFTPEGWLAWMAETKAGVVPGAREFLAAAHARGVRIYYVTNRTCDASKADDPTVRTLQAHALPLSPGRLLCRTDTGDKSPRRRTVAYSVRILLLIGDDLNDFMTVPAAGRAEAVAGYGRYWGERWFMLPNPTYGSWEAAVGSTVDAKRKALRQ